MVVAFIGNAYETETVVWGTGVQTKKGNFLPAVVPWPAIMTDLNRNGWPT